MWLSVLNFIGPLVLGVILTTAIEAATGKTWGALIRRRFLSRAKKRLAAIGISDDLIRRGPEAMYIVEFVPDGWQHHDVTFEKHPAQNLAEALESADPSHLPAPAATIVARADDERARLEGSTDGWWNGETVGVKQIRTGRRAPHETPTLAIVTAPSDHATATACTTLWQQTYDESLAVLPVHLGIPIPGMLHAVGLNATLVTADDRLILTKRSPLIDSGRGGWHISVNEGMQDGDRDSERNLDPHVGMVRGVSEELGLVINASDVSFHTAMFDIRRYQFGLLGHIDLRGSKITAAEIRGRRKLGESKDKFENTRIEDIPWDPVAVLDILSDPDWVAHGWLNLVLSGMKSFPRHINEFRALLDDPVISQTARSNAS